MRTATAMPGRTPRSATPANATIDTTNSIRRCFQRRTVPGMSASDNDAAMTTDASTGWGRFRNSPGTNSSMAAIIRAPVTPVSWLLAPARSATAVRDPLVLTGKPWNSPAARLAVPMPIISWLASTSWPVRSANADDVEIVSVSDTRVMPSAPATSNARSANPTSGRVSGGKPWGSSPTSATPSLPRSNTTTAAMAATTATSTPGTLGATLPSPRMMASPATPMAKASGTVSPSATPRTKPLSSSRNESASMENPKSFGSWPTRIVRASPFM